MRQFNWKEFFRQHPLFSCLTEGEVARLLSENASQKRELPPTYRVIKQGEVAVGLHSPDGNFVPISEVRKGGFFGEMALLEQRSRSATVVTKEDCVVLEIQGDAFLSVLHQHPELQFKLLRELSERLRKLTEHALTVGTKDVDEKLKLFNAKLDAELKAINASLLAAQAIFDQTSKRADEVINSAERSRTRLTVGATTIGGVFTTILAVLAFLGVTKLEDISSTADRVETLAKSAEQNAGKIEANADSVDKLAGQAANIQQILASYNRAILVPSFPADIKKGADAALTTYVAVAQTEDTLLKSQVFKYIKQGLFSQQVDRDNYTSFLKLATAERGAVPSEDRIILQYLLLCSYAIEGHTGSDDYARALADFGSNLANNPGLRLPISYKKDIEVDDFESYVDQIVSAGLSGDRRDAIKKQLEEIWGKLPWS